MVSGREHATAAAGAGVAIRLPATATKTTRQGDDEKEHVGGGTVIRGMGLSAPCAQSRKMVNLRSIIQSSLASSLFCLDHEWSDAPCATLNFRPCVGIEQGAVSSVSAWSRSEPSEPSEPSEQASLLASVECRRRQPSGRIRHHQRSGTDAEGTLGSLPSPERTLRCPSTTACFFCIT